MSSKNTNTENNSSSNNKNSLPTSPNLTTFSNKNLSTFENYLTLINQTNIDLTVLILSYIQYDDIITLKHTNNYLKTFFSSKKLMRYYIIEGNINKNNRLIFYQSNISISKQYEKIKSELLDYKIENNFYSNILKLANSEQNKIKNFQKTIEEINNDITRTCFTKKFEKGNGQIYLKNILTAFAFIRPEIGYCQGMNFIVAALIDFIYNEEKVFWIFLSFIDDGGINTLYFKNMYEYNIRFYQLNYYFKKYFPKIDSHFQEENLNPEIFFSKWILTVFSNYLSFNVLYDVWDLFIIDKWKAIFKVSLTLVNYMYNDFLNLTMNNLSNFFKENEFKKNDIEFDDIIDGYEEYKITNSKLNELKDNFYIEQLEKKLVNNSWDNDQESLVNDYNEKMNKYMKNYNKNSKKIKEKIKNLDKIIDDGEKFYENLIHQIKENELKIEEMLKEKEIIEKNMDEDFNIDASYFENKSPQNIRNNISITNKNSFVLKLEKDDNDNNNNDENNVILKTETTKKNSTKILKNIRNKNNKKIQNLDKNIQINIENIVEKTTLKDEKKFFLDRCKNERAIFKQDLEKIENEKNDFQKNLLKILSQKLKLSAKFVATNNY